MPSDQSDNALASADQQQQHAEHKDEEADDSKAHSTPTSLSSSSAAEVLITVNGRDLLVPADCGSFSCVAPFPASIAFVLVCFCIILLRYNKKSM